MSTELDEIDLRILRELQRDATLAVENLAERVHLSRNACWRRVKRMEASGTIKSRVALLDASELGVGLSVFVMLKAKEHSADWLTSLRRAVSGMPEIVGAFRMSGDLDYLLRVRVGSVADYDDFYQRLIEKLKAADISASFVMEEIKDTTQLPI
ncbi:MAG: Lrp/AsnC family transcriptional regulator [Silicimonas sp.]|nr:Lrp/AsnC family transcriptional regulator [Silicimonas sp.]